MVVAALEASPSPPAAEEREATLRAAIADRERKLAECRSLLDHDDPVTVAVSWIAVEFVDAHFGQHGLGRLRAYACSSLHRRPPQPAFGYRSLRDAVRPVERFPRVVDDRHDRDGVVVHYVDNVALERLHRSASHFLVWPVVRLDQLPESRYSTSLLDG